jgi:hypothetical protein
MNILVQPPTPERLVLWNLGWKSYEWIVEALNEQHVRST